MANVNVFFEKYKKQIGFVLLVSLIIWGGDRLYAKLNPKVNMAFYAAENNLKLTDEEENILLSNSNSALYLHLMDVVWDEEKQFAIPTSQLKVEKALPEMLTLIPVVNIMSEVFEHMNAQQADELGQMIAKRIEDKLLEGNVNNNPIKGLLLDCDWSPATKDRYFIFVQSVASYFQFPISVALRLRQIKYLNEMGIPPVKKGMLVFDKVSDLSGKICFNPITEPDLNKDYLSNINSYPLSIDIGVPLLRGAVVKRANEQVCFIPGLSMESLGDTLRFKKLNPSTFEVLEDSSLKNFQCIGGDKIEIEEIQKTQLKKALVMLDEKIKKEKRDICFYQINPTVLKEYSKEYLEEILAIFN